MSINVSLFSSCLGNHVDNTLTIVPEIPRRHTLKVNSMFLWILQYIFNVLWTLGKELCCRCINWICHHLEMFKDLSSSLAFSWLPKNNEERCWILFHWKILDLSSYAEYELFIVTFGNISAIILFIFSDSFLLFSFILFAVCLMVSVCLLSEATAEYQKLGFLKNTKLIEMHCLAVLRLRNSISMHLHVMFLR